MKTSDRVINAIIGASLGAAFGGAFVATLGVGVTVIGGVTYVFAGAKGLQTFAIGALAFDSFAIVVAPFFNIEVDPIEWE